MAKIIVIIVTTIYVAFCVASDIWSENDATPMETIGERIDGDELIVTMKIEDYSDFVSNFKLKKGIKWEACLRERLTFCKKANAKVFAAKARENPFEYAFYKVKKQAYPETCFYFKLNNSTEVMINVYGVDCNLKTKAFKHMIVKAYDEEKKRTSGLV